MKITGLILSFLTASLVQAQTYDSIWQQSIKNFEQQNFHGTIEDLTVLLKTTPDFPDAYYNRGIARINLGDIENACIDLQTAQSYGLAISKDFFNYTCSPDLIRNLLVKEYYKNEVVLPELGYRPKYTRADTLRGALNDNRSCYDVHYYDLRVRIIPKGKRIEGSNVIYFRVKNPTSRIQVDLFDNFEITSVLWKDQPLPWHREYNAIFIDFPQTLQMQEYHNITIQYRGKPRIAPNPPWDGGFVWKRDKNKDLWLGVACEHLGASSWWPNKDHLTDKPDSMQIVLEVPKDYQAVSNGNLRKSEVADRQYNRFYWFVQYPINNYNVTFYVGKYTSFSDTLIQDRDTLSLDYNVLHFNLESAREHFRQTREVVAFYNEAFGYYPFPKDGFGLVESPYEGMEHQSAIAFGSGFEKNSNMEYRNEKYDYIIVHEAAHEWWGNSVTASDMADIWIHEGFATYAEYLFLEKKLGKEEYLYELTDKSRYIFNVWPLVQNRNVNENTFASNDVYNKGAMLLHCLRCSINNDSVFLGMLKDFCMTNRYKTVTSDDFIGFVNHYTGSDYTAFFRLFLYGTKLPVLAYRYTTENNDLLLTYRWIGVDEGFKMPFGIGTNNKESFRMVGETSWKQVRLANTAWFNFYNLWKGYDGCADNSFTYFNTHCENNQ